MEDFYFKFSGADTYKAVENFIKNGLCHQISYCKDEISQQGSKVCCNNI